MPLSGFLLKPMQRVTRYPLLIEKVTAQFRHLSESIYMSGEMDQSVFCQVALFDGLLP